MEKGFVSTIHIKRFARRTLSDRRRGRPHRQVHIIPDSARTIRAPAPGVVDTKMRIVIPFSM